MKTTMRSAATAGALAILLSACGGSPTSSATVEPAGPSFDGGFTMGSGNRTMPVDTSDTGAQNSAAAEGGFTMGSGN